MHKIGKFNVRMVYKGDRYGFRDCLVHDIDAPMVEIYDARYTQKFGPAGQFISRYYAVNLLMHHAGLILQGGIPEWSMSYEEVLELNRFICDALATRWV